jgi:acetyl esterase/lipase
MPAPPSGPEHDTTTPTDKPIASRPIVRLGNVADPTLTLYLAPASHNTGAAVVVFPGGGYSILAIDPHRIGVLGFSAGAHLAVALSTHYDQRLYPPIDAADQQSSKPDFALVIYPGYLAIADKNFEFNPDIPVTAAPPPTFLVQAEDDPVHVENVIEYFLQLKRAGVPAELHVYSKGGHGYGLRPTDLPVTRWPTLATTWMKTVGVIGK